MIIISLLGLFLAALALYDQNQTLKEIRAYNEKLEEANETLNKILKAKPIVSVDEIP